MKVFGVDPGSNVCGWAVVDGSELVASGVVAAPSNTLQERIVFLANALAKYATEYGPVDRAAIETPFVGRRQSAVIPLCHARGAILAALWQAGVRVVHDVAAPQAKKHVTGDSAADKQSVVKAVSRIYPHVTRRPDACDAVAVALYDLAINAPMDHTHSARLRISLRAAD